MIENNMLTQEQFEHLKKTGLLYEVCPESDGTYLDYVNVCGKGHAGACTTITGGCYGEILTNENGE